MGQGQKRTLFLPPALFFSVVVSDQICYRDPGKTRPAYAYLAGDLIAAYDEIFSEKISPKYIRDGVECKLFGIGSEDYVVGSHEF